MVIAVTTLAVALVVLDGIAHLYLSRTRGDFPAGLFATFGTDEYRLSAGFSGRVRKGFVAFDVHANRFGYRDRDWTDAPENRIGVFGSSAAMGTGTEMPFTIAGQLQTRLAPRAEVMNFGIYGYGPPQALQAIQRECSKYRLRSVVYLHDFKLTRSDFLMVPGRTVVNGMLRTSAAAASAAPAPASHDYDVEGQWAPQRLAATRAFLSLHGMHPTQLAERAVGMDRLSRAWRSRYLVTTDTASFPPENVARATETISKMREASRVCGAAFAVVLLPGPAEAYYGVAEPAGNALARLLSNQNKDLIDLRQALPSGQRANLAGIDDFNARSNKLLAEAIANALLPRLN